jgi:hypothetical protein
MISLLMPLKLATSPCLIAFPFNKGLKNTSVIIAKSSIEKNTDKNLVLLKFIIGFTFELAIILFLFYFFELLSFN